MLNPLLDRFQRAMFFLFLGIFLSGVCSIVAAEAMHIETCIPIVPKKSCKLSRYEIRIYAITEKGAPLIGVAEGACVYVVGEGKYKRYAMAEAYFTAMNRTDYMDRGIEVPADQSIVCEIR